MLTGCKDYDEEVVISSEPVTVELAYTFSSVAGTQTRQSDEVVTDKTNSRYPKNLVIIPMIGQNPQPSEVSWNEPVEKAGAGDKAKSLLYHSSYCDMVTNVDGCLVYGSVEDKSSGSIPVKVYNGSLTDNPLSSVRTQSDLQTLSFSLESIYSDTEAPGEASTLAGYLNAVVNHDDVTGWKTSQNPILKNLFENFTGHGSDLPGSAASVKKWIEALATAAQGYYDNPPSSIGEDEKTILNNIVAVANGINITVNDNSYPRNKYLPDGAAAVRWTTWTDDQGSHEGFRPAMQTTTLDNINSVSRFVYPAPLYYFVGSGIKASETKVDFATVYNGVTTTAEKTAWECVLESFDKTKVTQNTKSVALEDPVQYAVAQLKLTVKAKPTETGGTTIKDNADNDITIGTDIFPLTGVIVCGQRPVNYRFEQASNSDVDVKFIYDSQVKTNGSDYYYLTTEDPNGGGPSTLVLQSYENEDVDIILEFQNNGTQTFKCIEGFVYPGTRFYLIGKIEAPTKIDNDEKTFQVFTKDYITTVNMTVSSLAKAYNILPNLLTSNLEIGVETTPQWVAATPTVIRME